MKPTCRPVTVTAADKLQPGNRQQRPFPAPHSSMAPVIYSRVVDYPSLLKKLRSLVSSHYFKSFVVNHSAARRTNIPVGVPILRCWLDLISAFVTGIKTIISRLIATHTNPSIVISRFVSNMLSYLSSLFHVRIISQ